MRRRPTTEPHNTKNREPPRALCTVRLAHHNGQEEQQMLQCNGADNDRVAPGQNTDTNTAPPMFTLPKQSVSGRRNVFRVAVGLCRNSWRKRRRNVCMSQGTEAITSHSHLVHCPYPSRSQQLDLGDWGHLHTTLMLRTVCWQHCELENTSS